MRVPDDDRAVAETLRLAVRISSRYRTSTRPERTSLAMIAAALNPSAMAGRIRPLQPVAMPTAGKIPNGHYLYTGRDTPRPAAPATCRGHVSGSTCSGDAPIRSTRVIVHQPAAGVKVRISAYDEGA